MSETVLVEGFEADAISIARLLAGEGHSVRLAGPGPGPREAERDALLALGVEVEPDVDLDRHLGPADVAYLDVWTPETSPRVRALRDRRSRITCAAELVVERAVAPVLGVTGSAGKSTAAAFAVQLLRWAGCDVQASSAAPFGNLWASAEHVQAIGHPADVIALELTSSHLAFMQTSPSIALITSFWPDHLELHGSLAAYRSAKETIVRGQGPDDIVVVDADDPAVAAFARLTPARRVEFSTVREVDAGAFLRSGGVVVREGDEEHDLGPAPFGKTQTAAVLAAAAAAVAAGVSPPALGGGLDALEPPPHRMEPVASVAGVQVVDDGMAATPSKTTAALVAAADRSVVLVCGGREALPSGPVHATPEELVLLEAACDEIARAARLTLLFGSASSRIEPLLRERRAPVRVVDRLEQAVEAALEDAAGAAMVLFSPMFPVEPADRGRFAELVRRGLE